MSTVGFIQRCVDAGLDLATALKAAAAFEAEVKVAVDEALEPRRAKDRERKKAPRIPRNSMESSDSAESVETLSPPLSPQTPQTPPHTRESITTREAKAREDAGFVRFWASYPRKTAKEDARKAFAKAWKLLPPLEADEVLAGGLERAKAGWVDAQFIPHAATWLNGKRWQDEADVIPLNTRKAHERHHPHQQTARQDRLGRSLAGLMAAVDEREPDVGGRHS